MMSIFDPLGILASFMVYIKILLQEIWRIGLSWDEKLPEVQYAKWKKWVQVLPTIENLQVPRQYMNAILTKPGAEIQVHVFVDASEEAFAAVAYLRCKFGEQVECAFIAAKSRVAPIKPMSIPRLELEAALLGMKLSQNIINGHSFEITRKIFWSDSRCVLSWLKSTNPRKYRQYVSHRVGEILEATEITDWRWIPSKMNVADEATKWQKIPHISQPSRWLNGPDFLIEDEDAWPSDNLKSADTEEELKKEHILLHVTIVEPLIDCSRFSSWMRLLRATAYVFKFVNSFMNSYRRSRLITSYEYQQAESYLYKVAQNIGYPTEVSLLATDEARQSKRLKKSSLIYKLSPYLDEAGVMRAWGRIDGASYIHHNAKRPIILPQDHIVTSLIVSHYHAQYHHHNHETVINELRQVYYIPKMRAILKRQRKCCQLCKINESSPIPPRMADLPMCRITPFTRPFTFVGVDFFGPMLVTVGRRNEKRWGMLFTCLTVRAVHVEVAHALTTDACILCLRNFTSRRGTPAEIYSDNGTNFHGAERELRLALKDVDQGVLAEYFITSNTKWKFNPPSAPHMGGSWERLVRSFKNSLYKILQNHKPPDALLQSTLIEIEHTINSRPLTYVPLETENDEALTPNHFLLGSTSGYKPLGEFSDEKIIMKKNWMISQQLAEAFWKRWIKEFLPHITRRSKWFEPAPPITEGDIVLIVDDQNPRNSWPRGRILKTFPAKDGQIRKVTVQTPNGIYDRPAVKIAVLDVLENSASKTCTHTVLPGENVTTSP